MTDESHLNQGHRNQGVGAGDSNSTSASGAAPSPPRAPQLQTLSRAELQLMQFMACGKHPDHQAWAQAQVELRRRRLDVPVAPILESAAARQSNVVSFGTAARRWLRELKERALSERITSYELREGEAAAALLEQLDRREEPGT